MVCQRHQSILKRRGCESKNFIDKLRRRHLPMPAAFLWQFFHGQAVTIKGRAALLL
jgi:hypothetical protein